jgi:hypothetical protein
LHKPPLQTSPPPHSVPSLTSLHVVEVIAGWQVWQALAGFVSLEA